MANRRTQNPGELHKSIFVELLLAVGPVHIMCRGNHTTKIMDVLITDQPETCDSFSGRDRRDGFNFFYFHHMNSSSPEGLKREIGVRALALNAFNLTVGAGIFTLPAVVASYLGSAAFLAYLLCAILITLVLLCFIESGSRVSSSGGLYVYIESAFGSFVGFLASTLFWLGYCVMADAAVANIVCDNLGLFFPGLQHPVVRVMLMAFIFSGIAFINVCGVRYGTRLMETLTLFKMMPLLLFIVVGVFFIQPQYLQVESWPSVEKIGEVSLILFFAFGGAEASLNASGEIKNPRRTIPRGILLGTFLIFIFYLSIHWVAQGVLGSALMDSKEAPLAWAAGKMAGNSGVVLLTIGAILSGLGLISGDILATSRLPYAAARDGLLPTPLAKIHPRFATPYIAILFYAAVGFLLAISGGFRQLAVMASAALLVVYIGVILATLYLRKKSDQVSFRIPGGKIIPIVALAATGWFLSHLASKEVVTLVLFLAGCSVLYWMMRWIKKIN